ncbi:hypothetical protein FHG64_10260 [Antarcticibacterium flavum]|uniref:DUF4382 domain-containing protein n=2 Tax=Antarcticibacterium TaxID=2058174 RepID=A0A5B7X386_9FLAO|nr:hypothetical protein [Antarcticibacterium flavum]QCY69750.1 hypothetical protein FHG64_10260 [Antarcticibacterium flavum]
MNRFFVWVLVMTSMGFMSCSSDDDATPVATLTMEARPVITSETSSPSVVGGANLLEAQIRLRDIGVIKAGESTGSRTLFGDGSVRQIPLLNSGLPAQPTQVGSAQLEQGNYDRVTLRLDRGQQLPAADPMNNRSLSISGTVNNMLLMIHTDVEEIITRTLQGGALNLATNERIFLNININTLFTGIDLTTAMDGNGDGTIEIEPSNIDENRSLYTRMVDNLPNAITVTRE